MSLVSPSEAEMVARAVTTFFQVWQPNDDAACRTLGIDHQSYASWKFGSVGPVTNDTLVRLVMLIRIYTNLRIMFSDPRRGSAWMQKPNAVFQGQSPLEILARGDINSLRRVRDYLTAEAHG